MGAAKAKIRFYSIVSILEPFDRSRCNEQFLVFGVRNLDQAVPRYPRFSGAAFGRVCQVDKGELNELRGQINGITIFFRGIKLINEQI